MDENKFRNKTDDELVHDGQSGMSGTGDSIEMMRRLRCGIKEQTTVMQALSRTGTRLTYVGLGLTGVGLIVAIVGMVK